MTGDPTDGLRPKVTRRSALGLALGGLALAACAPAQPTGGSPASPKTSTGVTTDHPRSRTATPTAGTPSPATPSPATPTPTPKELPLGGNKLFPRYRLAGWCGAPSAPTLGELGLGDLDDKVSEMVRDVAVYGDGRTVLPVIELIAVVVQGSPGPNGLWRYRQPDSVVERWLTAARKHNTLLLLNIQPGRAAFLDEVMAFADYLVEPDVGIALDPEWAMAPGQVPGRAYGHTDGKSIDDVARYLASIVKQNDLPEKALVYHQVARTVVRDPAAINQHDGVQIIRSVDGIGSRADKTSTWKWIGGQRNPAVRSGFKLFFSEDRKSGRLMTPAQVLALTPRPDYVMYE